MKLTEQFCTEPKITFRFHTLNLRATHEYELNLKLYLPDPTITKLLNYYLYLHKTAEVTHSPCLVLTP